jgi:hypothetical protein
VLYEAGIVTNGSGEKDEADRATSASTEIERSFIMEVCDD